MRENNLYFPHRPARRRPAVRPGAGEAWRRRKDANMKITINVDCTPEEARSFLGLPDVRPLQASMMDEAEKRMRAGMDAMDPETLMKTWMPVGVQGFEQLQKMFWAQMGQPDGRDDA